MESGFKFADLFDFEKLIAPKVLKIVYYLGLAAIALAALISFFRAVEFMRYDAATGLGGMVISLLVLALGGLMWRVMIELYITFFGIFDRLGEIRDSLKKD
jgi:hypothetical protein